MTAPTLTNALEAAALTLQDALVALAAYADAKRTLEVARAHLLEDGVEGKNEAQRDAKVRMMCEHEHDAVHQAEQALMEARCGLDVARVDWDLARYTVRALEVSKAC